MQNLKLLIASVIGTLVLVIGVAFLFSAQEKAPVKKIAADILDGILAHVRESMGSETTEATTSGQPVTKLRVVEFSDFQCPACKASAPLVQQLFTKYPGRIQLVYRHFPLQNLHKNAYNAALASEAVSTQNKFWEYHDLLFEKQEEWSEANNARELFADYAKSLGVDPKLVTESFDKQEYKDKVEKDINDGMAAGINATPTFFVDGEKVMGSELLETVAAKL